MNKAVYEICQDRFCPECANELKHDYIMRELGKGVVVGDCRRCGKKRTVVSDFLYTMSKRGYDRLHIKYP